MKQRIFGRSGNDRGTLMLWFSALAALSFLVAGVSSAQQPQESRPRSASPTSIPTPRQTAQPTPVQTGPGRRIPQLGEPPPAPILKPKPTPTPDPNSAEINEGDILKFNAELVTLNVRVIDRNNRPINNISKDEFTVLEDGVRQPIFSFTQEEVPIVYGLAVDTSQSLRTQFTEVLDAAKTIVNSNKPGDETFLEQFVDSEKIETVQDFSASKHTLLEGIDNLYMTGGQTAVIDGVYLAAEHVAQYKKGKDDDRRRRALIVVTDGEDRQSYYTETQLFQSLREADVQIYVIGFVNELDTDKGFIRKSTREKAVALINRIASETGGRAFFPQSLSEVPNIAHEIVRDMRTQYVISYDPTNKAHDGTYRSIKVAVAQPSGNEKRIALTRSGRTANSGSASVKPPIRPAASPMNNNVRQPLNTPRRSP